MSTPRRILAFVVAAYLLLLYLDRFVLVELLVRRIALPLVVALAAALAAIGTGFVVRLLRGRFWRIAADAGRLDPAVDLLLGYPIFGTICFLVALLHLSVWSMIPPLVLFALAGGYAVVRKIAADRV